MDKVLEAIDQFAIPFCIWRIEDQMIVYSNKAGLEVFGGTEEQIGKVSLWDLIGPLDTNLILLEAMRSKSPDGPDLYIPESAFATFRRLDNKEIFTGWYRAKDIDEDDGSTKFRCALIFADYDTFEDDKNWSNFLKIKEEIALREQAATFAHLQNNALASLQVTLESFMITHKAEMNDELKNSLASLKDIGDKMRQAAHIRNDLVGSLGNDAFQKIMPNSDKPSELIENNDATKILVVDDDEVLANSLAAVITMRNLSAEPAFSIQDALDKASKSKPTAALIDLVIGDESGWDLGRELQALVPGINIVYMTGFSTDGPRIQTTQKEVVLKKPFSVDVAIAHLLNIHGAKNGGRG